MDRWVPSLARRSSEPPCDFDLHWLGACGKTTRSDVVGTVEGS